MRKLSKAFTLIEVLIAITIFSFVVMFSLYLYVDTVHNDEKLSFERELYEEARFTLERVVSEFRNGTIDYAEYWNMSHTGACEADLDGSGEVNFYEQSNYGRYGNCYQFYAASFFDTNQNSEHAFYKTVGGRKVALEHQGENDADAIDGWQEELYIINANGNRKTILRKRANDGIRKCEDIDYANEENAYCRLEMLEMVGQDIDVDGKVDTWVCDDDFGGDTCTPDDSFRPISTPNIDITDLKFFIAPIEDPYKAYEEDIDNYLQPHVSIIFSSRTPQRRAINLRGKAPNITLQTTISARVYEEVSLYNNY